MSEKINRKNKSRNNQERQLPANIQELINRYDLDNDEVYDYIESIYNQLIEDIDSKYDKTGGTLNGDLIANGIVKTKKSFNNHTSRITDANQIKPNSESEYGGFRKDVATASMTLNKPPMGDAHIFTMFWDSSNRYDSQMAISNNIANKLNGVAFRGANNGSWNNWKSMLDMIYPVGAIYLSTNNTNPGTLFGGTWERMSGGFLYGAVGDSASVGNGAGTSTNSHTLTTSQIPSHTHGSKSLTGAIDFRRYASGTIDALGNFATTSGGILSKAGKTWSGTHGTMGAAGSDKSNSTVDTLSVNATHEHTSVGGGQGHSHNIPYMAVIIWKRTA